MIVESSGTFRGHVSWACVERCRVFGAGLVCLYGLTRCGRLRARFEGSGSFGAGDARDGLPVPGFGGANVAGGLLAVGAVDGHCGDVCGGHFGCLRSSEISLRLAGFARLVVSRLRERVVGLWLVFM